MRNLIQMICLLLAAGFHILTQTGCSPQAKKDGHLKRADGYFALGQYDKAEIEYLNALQIEPLNAPAISRLGLIYFDQGRIGRVMPFLVKGRELQPDNLDVRYKLGLIYLSIGKWKEAAMEAGFILDRRPQDAEAPILLAESAVNPEAAAAARQRLTSLPAPAADSAPVLVALGHLEYRQRQPKEAEATLRRALAQDPKSSAAQAALGTLYRMRNELPQAAQAFKLASEYAPARSPRQLLHARFKVQTGDLATARTLLEEITRKTPDYLPAWILLAEITAAEKKYPESSALITKVLTLDPAHPEALLLNGKLKLAMGEKDKAIADMEKMLKIYPQSPPALYQLGSAYYSSGDITKAATNLNQAVSLAPGFPEAVLLLAEINFRKGDYRLATTALTNLVQQRPDLAQARFLLAETYRAQGEFAAALTVYQQLEQMLPRNPQPPHWRGMLLLQQNKRVEARQAFQKALELAPDFLLSLDQLIGLDLLEKNFAAARQRVEKQIALDPKEPGPHLLQARVYLAQQELAQAENSLRKAIELQPDAPAPYLLLARLYASSSQLEKALANFNAVLLKNPGNLEALMMIGTIQNQQKNYPAAREAYEKLLTVNPKFSPALNNLAYIYSEQTGELDKAHDMARKARELLPNEPHTADTLGWILYKKGQFPWALSLLQESAARLSDNAEVQFHMGMTHYMMGAEQPARTALQLALQLQNDFPGAEEARRNLDIMAIEPETAGAKAMADLEKILARRPADPVALVRLAAIHTRNGAMDKAVGTYETALRANPKNVSAMLGLAGLHLAQRDPAKALDMAKAARKLAPDDAETARTLGRLAYQTGDYNWALSLFQEVARKSPDDPELQFNLAEAAYRVGRVAEAEAAMQRVLAAGALLPRAVEARRFLEMTALAARPASGADRTTRVDEALESNPDYVPALMARAVISEQTGAVTVAQQGYEKVLGLYPDFFPAKRRLAILYSTDPARTQKAFDLALKAREAYPEDPELAKAFGLIVYRQGDYTRAANLLRESARQRGDDAELMYFLGAAQHRLKQGNESRQSLQRALSLGLKPDLAADAQRLLAEFK